MSPDQQALYAAVVASPDDDLPRLVYADWLEEHGDADRAEFIRVQCRLANSSPDDADHFDLLERETELRATAADEVAPEWPPLPAGWQRGAVRRGFPEEVILHGRYVTPVAGEISRQFEQAAAACPLTRCELTFSPGPGWELLGHPVAERLRGLEFGSSQRGEDVSGTLTRSPHLRFLRDLTVSSGEGADGFTRLLASGAFPQLRSLRLTFFDLAPPDRPAFAAAVWRERLEELAVTHCCHGVYHRLAGRCAFPSLRHLTFFGALSADQTALLNDTSLYPALTTLHAIGTSTACGPPGVLDRPIRAVRLNTVGHDPGLQTLLTSPALRTVRQLNLSNGAVGDDWPVGFSRPGVFSQLRHLNISLMPGRAAGLAALASAPFWETVTSLSLHRSFAATPDDWAAFFRALNAPVLRHLTLWNVPLKSKGGLALAANRSLANLRLLSVKNAKPGKKANRAIVTAPHLQRLLSLELREDDRQEGYDPLADPGVLPHAKRITLGRVKLTPEVAEKLRRRPEVRFEGK
jgi:uncharacterized protein (TIGR02996 family)